MHEFHFLNMSKTQEVIVKYNKNRVHIIESYLKQPDVEIVAGADLIEGKAEAFFQKILEELTKFARGM